MVKRRLVSPLPNLSSIKLFFKKKFLWKIVLGVLFLYLFSNYQPSFSFSPLKKINKAIAAEEQTQVISAERIPHSFQLPHPGYLSTYFSTFHPGVDIATGLGMPIKSIAPGVVIDAGFNVWGLGLIVEIDHENGYKSLYAHLGKIYVSKGQKISESDYLGEVGLTGHTTGPHTHLEISLNDQKINPLTVLPEIRTYPESGDFIAQGGTSTESATLVTQWAPTPTPKPSQTPQPTELEILVKDPIIQPKTESILDKVIVTPTTTVNTSKPMDLVKLISSQSVTQTKSNPLISKLSLF
jgi:hypothetical protein